MGGRRPPEPKVAGSNPARPAITKDKGAPPPPHPPRNRFLLRKALAEIGVTPFRVVVMCLLR